MTFKERLSKEKDNLTKIILFNDRGLFFNLIERSAYAFCTRIKPFKVQVKTLKGVDEPFVSIGVPVEKKDYYLHGMKIEEDDQGNISAHLTEPIDENAFRAWKNHVIEENKTKTSSKDTPSDIPFTSVITENKDNNDTLIRECFLKVKALNIASMTPMEAMIYLNNLQQKLKDIK